MLLLKALTWTRPCLHAFHVYLFSPHSCPWSGREDSHTEEEAEPGEHVLTCCTQLATQGWNSILDLDRVQSLPGAPLRGFPRLRSPYPSAAPRQSPRRCARVLTPGICEGDSSGNRAFADVTKVNRRSDRITGGPKSYH